MSTADGYSVLCLKLIDLCVSTFAVSVCNRHATIQSSSNGTHMVSIRAPYGDMGSTWVQCGHDDRVWPTVGGRFPLPW